MASLFFKFSTLLIIFALITVAEGATKSDSPKKQEKHGEEKLQRRNWYEVSEEKKESKGYEKKKKEDNYEEKDSSRNEYNPKPSYTASVEEQYNRGDREKDYGGYGGRRDERRGSYERSREAEYKNDNDNYNEEPGYESSEYTPKREYGSGYSDRGRKDYEKPQQKYSYRERPRQEYGEKKRSSSYNSDYGMKSRNYKEQSDYSPFSSGYAHSHDTHYCSIHGSFALALPTYVQGYGQSYKEGDSSYSSKEGYSDDSGYGDRKEEGYGGKSDSYGSASDKQYRRKSVVRHHTRQFCRYAAAYSYKACRFCCKVVARSANTSPDEIVAAIFSFDPSSPSSNGAGIDYGSDGYGQQEKSGYSYNTSSSKYQCVCCAPKFKY